jgi:HlyD family secretion protein
MKTWKKVLIGTGAVVVIGGVVLFSIYQSNKDVVKVQTGKVARQDLTSIVSASGEVRPKEYTNVLGQGFGKITEIVVKEGDHVKQGDVLLRLESVQPAADVAAQRASIDSSQAGVQAAQANFKMAQATLEQRQADLEKAKFDWGRSQALFNEQLIAKQEYDASKAAYDAAVAAVSSARAQVAQNKAAVGEVDANLAQGRAMLTHQADVLSKTVYVAPIAGIVTYIAIRVGENVVPGIQNAEGSYLMTISDMSTVTAEVKVDETDITVVKLGQTANVAIDALPGKTYKGNVTQVGDQAILRTSGLATTQTEANSQEARDFKVIVTLENPPDGLRPGLSSTAKIQTAHKSGVLAIPIQALAIRSKQELAQAASGKQADSSVTLAAAKTDDSGATKDEVQGVFVVRNGKAVYVPVKTGVTGVTDIEITSGLQEGDEIITGSYSVLRTLKPNARIKVDNSVPKPDASATTS